MPTNALIDNIDSKWGYEVDGLPTFFQAICLCHEKICRYWNENTQAQYGRDYNDKILPALKDHDATPIANYTKEDYDAAIALICDKGRNPNGDFVPYADSTIQHYCNLIKNVVFAASEIGICDNVLWGSIYALSADEKLDINERILLKNRRTLTIQQEVFITHELLKDIRQYGQRVGLLLMHSLGLRNGEACGANYGDIKPITPGSEEMVLWVYKTTEINSNELKSSGKTRNADRIVPIPRFTNDYLSNRRMHIEKRLEELGLEADVNDLPIACFQDDYFERCSAAKLTTAGRELFRLAKVDENLLAQLDAELLDEMLNPNHMEKDPTAYLLRRNFATHLDILGLTEAEIQYVIGHDIEDMYETRNEFVDEKKLLAIQHKMAQRPLLNPIDDIDIINVQPYTTYSDEANQKTLIRAKLLPGELRISITPHEPGDTPKISFLMNSSPAAAHVDCYSSIIKPNYKRTVNVLKQYQRIYKDAQQQFKKRQGKQPI